MPLTTGRGGAASAIDDGAPAVAARFGLWPRGFPTLPGILGAALACIAALMLGALLAATALGSDAPLGAGLPATPRAVLSERALAAGQPLGSAGPLARVVLPTVVTGAATAITQTTATLNGTVNPNGGDVTECRFIYYGGDIEGEVPCSSPPGSGDKPVAVSAPIEGLEPNTEYGFELIASYTDGTAVEGSELSFATPAVAAPTVVTGAASAVTQSSATVHATVNPNDGEVTDCYFEYGTTTSYTAGVECTPEPGAGTTPVSVSALLTVDLAPNTTYHYRIVARSSIGTSYGGDRTFKTPPDPPTVVTGAASVVTQTGATLSGTVNPNGGGVTTCRFEYGTSVSYGSSVSCAKLPGAGEKPVAVSAALTGLSADTTYHFRVVAVNASGENQGADQTFKTLAIPVVDLVLPTTSNPVGTNFSETATVTEGGAPLSGVPVQFTVMGVNPQTATVTTNEAGQATFAYTGEHTGTDHIVASFVDKAGTTEVSNEVTKAWIEPESGGGTAGGGTTGGGATGGGTTGGGTTGGGTTGGGTTGDGGTTGGGTSGGGGAKGGVLSYKELSPPVLGKTVNVVLVSGVVFVKLPPGAHLSLAEPLDPLAGQLESAVESLSKGIGFIPLTEARQIPVGSTLETTHGVVQLTTATAARDKVQSGDFGAGIFKLLQNRRQRGLTDLDIVNSQSARQVCATVGKRASAASRHLSSRVLGGLNANAHGKFSARGQYSAATVRGTIWSVTNQCDGTLTRVKRGVVSVRDFVRRKTFVLFTGQHYLAKP